MVPVLAVKSCRNSGSTSWENWAELGTFKVVCDVKCRAFLSSAYCRFVLRSENLLARGSSLIENGAMPRIARADVGGYCYHALKRGNGRARVFHDDEDYHDFVRLLRQACARVPMRLVGFCVLPNHFHAVLWPHKAA